MTSLYIQMDERGYQLRNPELTDKRQERDEIITSPDHARKYRQIDDLWSMPRRSSGLCKEILIDNEKGETALIFEIRLEDIGQQLPFVEEELSRKILDKVPQEYYDLLRISSKYNSGQISTYRYIDHRINLREAVKTEQLGYSPFYKMSLDESEACRKYITKNLQGFIEGSSALWAAPSLLVFKSNGGVIS